MFQISPFTTNACNWVDTQTATINETGQTKLLEDVFFNEVETSPSADRLLWSGTTPLRLAQFGLKMVQTTLRDKITLDGLSIRVYPRLNELAGLSELTIVSVQKQNTRKQPGQIRPPI